MTVQIHLTIEVTSDFHLGTGTGRGRVTDAVVLTNRDGVPFISGSTIKGLCRWQACRLIDCFPGLGPKPIVKEPDEENAPTGRKPRRRNPDELQGPAFEIFGGGSQRMYAENRVWFDHASALVRRDARYLTRSGRSARDRLSGRTRDKHLFFYEDAGPDKFATKLTCDENLSREALLLLVLSLRRIEALGGQRRRGKGRCECTVKIVDPGGSDELAGLKGLTLPYPNEQEQQKFQSFAKPILEEARGKWVRSTVTATNSDESAQPESNSSVGGATSQPAVWMVFAVARSPLTLGLNQAVDNTVASEDFISGTSLRGALAWQAIREKLHPNSSLFQNVFVREGVQFGPLYPASSEWTSAKAASMPFPIPASFCTCKHFPGSKTNPTTSQSHGLADRMWHAGEDCDYCQAVTKQADGYLQLIGNPAYADLCLGRPATRVFQRTAIDEATLRGAEGQLFGLESVQQRTKLAGYIWGPENLLEQALGNRLDKWTPIRVGKAKSRGQGLVEIFLCKASDKHAAYSNLLRLKDVSSEADAETKGEAMATRQQKESTSNADEACNSKFYITLYSDLIAVDDYLRPVTTLTENMLWQLLDQTDEPPFTIEKGFVSVRRIGGFLGVVGLPRTPDIAIAAGSTWRLCWKDGIDEATRTKAWKELLRSEQSGLGLRRGEGFGRLVLNHPVHVARWDDMTLPSRSMSDVECTPFPSERVATQPKAPDRSRQLAVELAGASTGAGDRAYQRLFAELAQAANPLESIQRLFDDPLYREGKAKDLARELKQAVGDQLPLFKHEHEQTICIAKTHEDDPAKVQLMREALKKHAGEVLDHA